MSIADVIIIGSGASALQLARHLHRDKHVIIITKSHLQHGNSRLAQGGIAAALDSEDRPFYHFEDTMKAGCSISDAQAVHHLTQQAPGVMKKLSAEGCPFDLKEDGNFSLGREGAHSYNRILHSGGDQTGRYLMQFLAETLPPNISVYEHQHVFELIKDSYGRCCGVRSKDQNRNVHTFLAAHIVMATGGCGQVYPNTSNASTITGDGSALAYHAGAQLSDMEFVQFHPTMLYINGESKGLITEAVRGEGAVLVDEFGNNLMDGVHPLMELAPRHIVAQRIHEVRNAGRSAYLDIRGVSDFPNKFPAITKRCREHGLSIKEGLLPVAPGCHFQMGGIQTDTVGRTSLAGFYAVGEAASNGLHGANRLASNSLLECLVYGKRLAEHLNSLPHVHPRPPVKRKKKKQPMSMPEQRTIQTHMMANVGIIRSKKSLQKQLDWFSSYEVEDLVFCDLSTLSVRQTELCFLMQTAWLITKSAWEREESRGAHIRTDYPDTKDAWSSKQIIQVWKKEWKIDDEPIETETLPGNVPAGRRRG
ncbi:L-aspartate oxidase [Halobacillus sp. KGW1]|uniref:L-aspartate oxidase n=1 Tax=Halobacillus sp. KGW1 TaxID=1793726 RepID=UPI0007867E67|nr:L-aspartate oxidase [Halobacillus sp. KGW1]